MLGVGLERCTKKNLITTTNKTLKVFMKMENQISSHRKKVPSVYAYSDSPDTDSDMENEMIINKNKEVTQTENYKRKIQIKIL